MVSQVVVDLGGAMENCCLGGSYCPRLSLTHAARGDALGHFLSTYYVPTILHLSLHLAFSTTLFTGKKTKAQREKRLAWNQLSLSQGSERRGSKGAVEQV